MEVRVCTTDHEIAACAPVMRELRPHISGDEFVERVRLQQADGYMLACLFDQNRPVGAAGFRIVTNLAWGRFLYVDDLVTVTTQRSKGYGAYLLKWLHDYACKEQCEQLHLDSGTERKDAHRFYDREGLDMTSYHYVTDLREPT